MRLPLHVMQAARLTVDRHANLRVLDNGDIRLRRVGNVATADDGEGAAAAGG